MISSARLSLPQRLMSCHILHLLSHNLRVRLKWNAQWGRMIVVRSRQRVEGEKMPEQMMFF